MLQTQQYTDMLVSVVGKLVGPTTLQACDGTNITLNTESAQEGLVVNPDLSIEIMGTAVDATTVMVRILAGCFSLQVVFRRLTCFSFFFYLPGVCVERAQRRHGLGCVQQNDHGSEQPKIRTLFSRHGCNKLELQFFLGVHIRE